MRKQKAAQFSHRDYDKLESAISRGQRLSIERRGTEYVVVPLRLRLHGGREAIDAVHPTTGEGITLYVDEIARFEVVK
jgi:hypothetical protein